MKKIRKNRGRKISRRNRKKIRWKKRKRRKSNNERLYGTNYSENFRGEMETKIVYQKNECSDIENYRNGYYPERTINTRLWANGC